MNLDPVAARLADAWGFRPTEELPSGFCSRVYADDALVLKVPFQGEEAVSGWRMALELSGSLGPRVLRHDPESGSLLMERVKPGTHLDEPEENSLLTLLTLGAEVRRLPTEGLMSMTDYFPHRTELMEYMLATSPEPVALHGDLHHQNVLRGPRGWVLIDPKGVIGDPAFEPSAAIRNPLDKLREEADLPGLLHRRIVFVASKTGFDPFRIWAWSLLALGTSPADDNRTEHALLKLEGAWPR